MSDQAVATDEELVCGSVAVGTGMGAVVRIPVPGTPNWAIELQTSDPRWRDRSTSTIFLQDRTGRKNLRLDYGFNVKTQRVDYHWNQVGSHSYFGIADHAGAGRGGAVAYHAAKAYRIGGRVLLLVGAALDAHSIVVADRPARRATEVASGWAGAWLGCKGVGYLGAGGGTLVKPGLGTAVGGVGGCIAGGVGGYFLGEAVGGYIFDWTEDTIFTPAEEVEVPQ